MFQNLKNKIKGFLGERKVLRHLKRTFRFQRIIKNFSFTDKNGNTHQVDLIAIRKNGIHVIEVKNYKGQIYGKVNDETWTQYFETQTFKIINPARQNETHCYWINEMFKECKIPSGVFINNIVTFVQNNHNEKDDLLCNLSDLRYNLTKDTNIYSKKEVKLIYAFLNVKKEKISKNKHIQNVEKYKRQEMQ